MNNEEIILTINGTTYKAVWFDKEDDRKAEWHISVDGKKVGKYYGYPADKKFVENFIRFYIAGA
jgi:hypothetical protein